MSERRTARAETTSTRRASSRYGRAILAGGLVLGVGAAITLANWNDSEFVNGTFAAGIFALEGSSTDGTTFSEHSSAGSAAVLDFQLAPDTLAPGDVVYAPFALRLGANSSSDATTDLTLAGTTGDLSGLTYEVIQSATWGCDAGTTGTEIVAAGSPLASAPTAAAIALARGAGSTPGDPAYLCFVVTASAGLVQGSAGTVTWELVAQSI